MKPAPFKYLAVESTDEAVAALAEHGDEAKILAGGQSLIPLMNLRLAFPSVLVDINRVDELSGVTPNGKIEIGATTRQAEVERSSDVVASAPIVTEALGSIAHAAVRSRGTVGGSLAHADPAAELPAVLLATGGEVVARGPKGERTIAADDLFVSYFTTALAEDEILTKVTIPTLTGDTRWGFLEVSRRHGDYALVGVALTVSLNGDVCESARIALFGTGEAPVRAGEAEESLSGLSLADDDAIAEAGQLTQENVEAKNDVHATSEYRKRVAGVLVRRALTQAATRNGGAK